MKLRTIAWTTALATIATTFSACEPQGNSQSVKIGLDASDEVKIAYMIGTQFGRQVGVISEKQLEFTLDDATFYSAIDDGFKVATDTTAKFKYPDSSMAQIAQMMNSRAATLQAAKAPRPVKKDSADTAAPKLPEKPAAMTGEQANKASYLIGAQFGLQAGSLAKQSELDLSVAAFKQSIKDTRAKEADTTKSLQLPQDTLTAVGQRFQALLLEKRKAAIEKAKKEEAELKEKVSSLRGDTLSDGSQAKLNYQVSVTGVSLSAKNLEAYAGKKLFVYYFSTTCPHCRKATPDIKAFAAEFKDKGISTIAVASGGNNKRDIRKYIEEYKLDEAGIDVFFDEAREFGELYSDGYVPKAYIVKPGGSLSMYKSFEAQKDSVKAELTKLSEIK